MPTLADQLAELERELALRLKVYPGWIREKKLSPEAAERRLATLRAAIATVRKVWELEQVSIEMEKEWTQRQTHEQKA